MNIDFAQNPKQEEFYNLALASLYGQNEYRNLNYGGAIRGGKSFVCAAIFLTAAKIFPNSRWHIFRADFPALQSTTIPTFEKIISRSPNWGWNRDKSNFYIYNRKSGSKIFFKGENITRDPELTELLGMETNGLWFEQIEELSSKLWEVGMSRNGSWYIDPMPHPITLSTFNPTQSWIKERIYDPWREGTLKAPYYFQHALPSDNKFVTQAQWDAWGLLAERYFKQFIEGDWTDFANRDNLFAFSFDSKKHVGQVKADRTKRLYLSFDFNKNPICCSVIQWYGNTVWIPETIKLKNSDIYKLCDHIKVKYPGYVYIVTGDASGQSSSALVQDNLNYYTVIKSMLGLATDQIKVPKVNPPLEDNQVLFNSILSHYKVVMDKEEAKSLIFDCQNVRMLPTGKIDKLDRTDETKQADALDTLRYWFNVFMWDFLKKIRS
jgi:hypothetical protein